MPICVLYFPSRESFHEWRGGWWAKINSRVLKEDEDEVSSRCVRYSLTLWLPATHHNNAGSEFSRREGHSWTCEVHQCTWREKVLSDPPKIHARGTPKVKFFTHRDNQHFASKKKHSRIAIQKLKKRFRENNILAAIRSFCARGSWHKRRKKLNWGQKVNWRSEI